MAKNLLKRFNFEAKLFYFDLLSNSDDVVYVGVGQKGRPIFWKSNSNFKNDDRRDIFFKVTVWCCVGLTHTVEKLD